jgi:anti-sigma regulatory factor (Ser/Thr protein kinase)
VTPAACRATGFSHEALFYADGLDGFVRDVGAMVAGTLADGGRAAVAAPADRVAGLHELLGDDDRVSLVDMRPVGVNPARLIPLWRSLADEGVADGAPFLGVGEPIWAGRSREELAECHRHEALINVAFAGDPQWQLVCPYDLEGLGDAVIEDAERTHPLLIHPDDGRRGVAVDPLAAYGAFAQPLSPVPEDAAGIGFGARGLAAVRALATTVAARADLGGERTADLLLAVTEMGANSVLHGGGSGIFHIWTRGGSVVCQSADAGHVTDPMVGRRRPAPDQTGGRGVWILHQLCDLVQMRSSAEGTLTRITVGA